MANLTNLLATLGGPLRGGAGLAALGVNRINALIETVRGLAAGDNLIAGRGIRLDKQLGKVVITSDATAGKPAAATFPFQLIDASTTSPAALKVRIKYGTVNEVVPTGMTDISGLTASPLPDPDKVVTITASTWFWLKCVGTFGVSDSYVVTIETTTTNTVPSGTSVTGSGFVSFRKIGSATVSGESITNFEQVVVAHQWVDSYGNTNLWISQ